ncbi:DNA internalization-related competence protein ComEC/Rec2 [Brevibacillus sp. H7]|uniref:DNA internalization-related competence protein ComEC/Rec2 n=1 Tax=Brevibacillus sp. H7 TaxID=3349138 RepID=UPI003815DE38
MFPVGLLIVLGLLLGAYVRLSVVWMVTGGVAALLLFVPFPGKKRVMWYTLICILAVHYFHGYDHLHRSHLRSLAAEEQTVWINGFVDSAVRRDGDIVRLYIQVEHWGYKRDAFQELPSLERIAVRLSLSAQEQTEQVASWAKGDRFYGIVKLSLPSPARNPHAFDYARFLRWQGVYVTAETDFSSVEVQSHGASLAARFDRWQNDGARLLETIFSDPIVSGYMQSLLLGMEESLSPELEEMYADLGLIHVLAISGLHVTLVSGSFLRLAGRAGLTRQTAAVVTVVFIGLYVLLVGASASAVRAGLMGALALGSQFGRTRMPVRDIWAVALAAMLIYNPYQLWHIGFQLSFAVTLGLILYVPIFQQLPFPRWAWAKSLIGVTVSAQLTSFPFLLYWFHQCSPVSWLINLVAVPVLSLLVLPAGYAAFLLALLHPALAGIPAAFTSSLLQLVHLPLHDLQQQPIPFSHWPHPHWSWLFACMALLFAVPFLWSRGYQRMRDAAVYVGVFVFLLVMARQPFSGDNEVRITFIDVGQGDSIVVEVGKKAVYLIDGGGTPRFPQRESWRDRRDPFEAGKDVVLPFLRARGIERIDRLVMTHGDYDHIGGLAALVPRFFFGAVLVNGTKPKEAEAELIESFRMRGVPVVTGVPGRTWCDVDQVCWSWLHPNAETASPDNDASIVLKLSAYGKTVLFMGDLEQAGEETLLLTSQLSPVDAVKVAHHGSGTSTTRDFLARIKPKAAVISAGKHNRYGHPSPEVIRRLQDVGADIYRTDVQGAVTLFIRPDGVYWKTTITDT